MFMARMYNRIVDTMKAEKYAIVDEEQMEEVTGVYDLKVIDDIQSISTLSGSLNVAIHFENTQQLRRYVEKVNVMGIMLGMLIISLDFGNMWICVVFSLAFSITNFITEITIEQSQQGRLVQLWELLLISCTYVVAIDTGFHFPETQISNYPMTSSCMCVAVITCGFSWAFLGRSGGFFLKNVKVTDMALDSQHTLFMLSMPTFFVLYRADAYEPEDTLFLTVLRWGLEPSLRTMCVVAFLYSVRAHRFHEVLLVLSLSILLKFCEFHTINPTRLYIFCGLVFLLLITHGARSYNSLKG